MDALLHTAMPRLLEASWHAAAMVLIVLVVQRLLGRSLSPQWRCAMWSLVFVRLLLPALPASPFSLANLRAMAPARAPAAQHANEITFGVIAPNASAPNAPGAPTGPGAAPTRIAADPLADAQPLRIVAILWMSVAVLLALRQLAGCFRFHLRLRRCRDTDNTALVGIVRSCSAELGVRAPRAVETELIDSPALAGVLQPKLLFPARLAEGLAPAELRFIVLHELAHLRRRDVPVGWIVALVAALHWPNPLVWLAAARYRSDRELACDAMVLARTAPTDRADYGRTLLKLLENFPPRCAMPAVAGMLHPRRSIRRRITAIADFAPSRWRIAGPLVFLAIGLATLTSAEPLTAQDATGRAASAPAGAGAGGGAGAAALVTRTYDVRDVYIETPNFTDAPQLGIQPATQPVTPVLENALVTRPARSHERMLQDLAQSITETVAPDSWKRYGGDGTIELRADRGELRVTQSPENQEAVQRFLQDLRGARGVQVSVEARFLTGDDVFAAIDAIGKGKRWQPARGYQFWPAYLNGAEVKELLRATQRSRQSTTITAPRVTVFNGQRAYVLVSRQTAFVQDLKPSTTQPGAYDPQIGIATSGVLLDVEANVSADRRIVTLGLRPQLTTLHGFAAKPWPGGPKAGGDTIQVPDLSVTRIDATTAVPDGQTALFRLRPRREAASTTRPAEEPVLLMVRPNIRIQEDK